MLDEMASAYGNRFLIAAAGVSLALLGLFIVLWILRHRAPSPFVRGGRNRQPRLQVLDAAAVDARRRLVLVRRDNIEHLIMIGGPTDIVIESGIGDERPYISVQAPQQESLPAPDRPAAALAPSAQQPQRIAPAANAAPAPAARPAPAREEPAAPRPAPSSPAAAKPVQPEPAPVVVTPPPPVAAKPVAQPEPVAVVPPAPQPAAPQAAPAPPTPVVDRIAEPSVEEVFEAARKRVMPTEPAEQPITPAIRPEPEPVRPAQPGSSEFEKFLEAEMSSHLDSVKAQQPAPRPIPTVLPPSPQTSAPSIAAAPVAARPAPPVGPAATPPPPPAAAAARPAQPPKEEPNLQTEIARIFGEMNPGRNE
ncbi:flagellar biosynthetic protein FliO [Pseudomonas sp. R2.Fl]|nr:flagellar biosynthetic protein FliO [Pseudomonas sp. R2.Fl]